MKPEDIPDFIYRGGLIEVDGTEHVIRDFCMVRKAKDFSLPEILVIQTKSGDIFEYDAQRVREVHGRAPDFIRPGVELFWRETQADMQKYNGVWRVDRYEVTPDPLRGKPHTKVELSLTRQQGNTTTSLRRVFNAATMFPVKPDAQPGRLAHILQQDISVLKPPSSVRRPPNRKP